ncbi:MAG TPA: hypothetical protein VIE67_09860 [Rudaea sp.]|jgi:putative transcriptional regulator|uniref:hypothetical protein n=1 Tax=Rudaea sp. TaxID=2136325 RepID=UPI002F924122
MNKKLFAHLVESMEQMGEISRGERAPSREQHFDAVKVKEVRNHWSVTSQVCFHTGCSCIDAARLGARAT